MKLRRFFATLVVLGLRNGVTQACVCEGVPKKDEIAHWVEDRTSAATYVFVARITELVTSGRIPALDTTARVEIIEPLKGTPRFALVTISECQNFELKVNDTRVLFVTADGVICGCTEYRHFIGDAQLLSMLRGISKNAK